MSQWGTNPENLSQPQGGDSDQGSTSHLSKDSSAESTDSQKPSNQPETLARAPWWIHVFPYCLSAFFFLTGFLVIFSPLPLLLFYFKKGRKWGWLAALTNSLVVAMLSGVSGLGFYLIWVVALSLGLSECLSRKKSVEFSSAVTLLIMGSLAAAVFGGYSAIHHLNPVLELQRQIAAFVDYLSQSVSVNSGMFNPGDLEESKQQILLEFPSALAIFSLIMVWANLILVFRVNPNGLRNQLGLDAAFLKSWKAPQVLVWPTIAAGFFLVVDMGTVSDVAMNVFKFMMAIYAIQGLSILSYFFDLWGVRGPFRFVGFSLSLFIMMPLVLSLGFFDLWFDFRSKFRQS